MSEASADDLRELRDKVRDLEEYADEIGAYEFYFRLGMLADDIGEAMEEDEEE